MPTLYIQPSEAIDHLLGVLVYCEQHHCEWTHLENNLMQIDYDKFDDEKKEWFAEFLMYLILRIWYSDKEDTNFNRVSSCEEGFLIENYDWKAFQFAKSKQVDPILIRFSKLLVGKHLLSEKECKWLQSKCK